MGKDPNQTEPQAEPNKETEPQTEPQEPSNSDEAVTIEALQNVNKELSDQIKELTKTVHDLQVSNKEMALRTGAQKEPTDTDLFSRYNRY